MEFAMELIRYSIAGVLLVFSSQASALFMPEGFSIDSDKDASSNEGCAVLITQNPSML
jgi:hypothetical protein